MNKASISGFIGTEPRITNTASGGKVASFRMATSNGKDKDPTWHTVVAWNNKTAQHADFVEKWLKKGKPITAHGKISYRKYEKDGVEREVTEIIADGFDFVPSSGGDRGAQGSTAAVGGEQLPASEPAMAGAAAGAGGGAPEDDDLPF